MGINCLGKLQHSDRTNYKTQKQSARQGLVETRLQHRDPLELAQLRRQAWPGCRELPPQQVVVCA